REIGSSEGGKGLKKDADSGRAQLCARAIVDAAQNVSHEVARHFRRSETGRQAGGISFGSLPSGACECSKPGRGGPEEIVPKGSAHTRSWPINYFFTAKRSVA